jgi:hypothetical protein
MFFSIVLIGGKVLFTHIKYTRIDIICLDIRVCIYLLGTIRSPGAVLVIPFHAGAWSLGCRCHSNGLVLRNVLFFNYFLREDGGEWLERPEVRRERDQRPEPKAPRPTSKSVM